MGTQNSLGSAIDSWLQNPILQGIGTILSIGALVLDERAQIKILGICGLLFIGILFLRTGWSPTAGARIRQVTAYLASFILGAIVLAILIRLQIFSPFVQPTLTPTPVTTVATATSAPTVSSLVNAPPSATSVVAPSDTPMIPSSTATALPTDTVVPPTNTLVPIPTDTPIPPTSTSIPPTATIPNPTATSPPLLTPTPEIRFVSRVGGVEYQLVDAHFENGELQFWFLAENLQADRSICIFFSTSLTDSEGNSHGVSQRIVNGDAYGLDCREAFLPYHVPIRFGLTFKSLDPNTSSIPFLNLVLRGEGTVQARDVPIPYKAAVIVSAHSTPSP